MDLYNIIFILIISSLMLHVKYAEVFNGYSSCTYLGHYAGSDKEFSLSALQSNITYSVSNAGDLCFFDINPEKAKKIRFYIQDLLIKQADFKMWDFTTGRKLFECVSCHASGEYGNGLSVPPIIESDTNNVVISIRGTGTGNSYDSSVNTFTISYFSITSENVVGNENLNIGLAAALDHLTPLLVNETSLPNNYKQTWIYPNPNILSLNPNPGRLSTNSSKIISFSFQYFHFGTVCKSSLKIYDKKGGALLFTGCKDEDFPQAWVYSRTGEFYLVLENKSGSDDDTAFFDLMYYMDKDLYYCGSLKNPELLIGSSMIISDGSPSMSKMRSEQRLITRPCTWKIQPIIKGTITLYFDWVSLMQGSVVRVYDGNDATGVLLWDSRFSTATSDTSDDKSTIVTPPPLTTVSNTMYIIYGTQDGSSSNFYGFKGAFVSNRIGSIGIGSGTVTLTMSSVLDLCPPGNGYEYSKNLNYIWNINPNSATAGAKITFVFSNLSIGVGDNLDIYDGSNKMWSFTSAEKTPYVWFKTTHSYAKVQFTSNNDSLSGNFKLSYFIDGSNHHCGFPTNPATLTAYSTVITDGSRSDKSLYLNQRCEWRIAPRDSVGIYVFFTRYNMQGARIDFYEGSLSGMLIASITDSDSIPSPIIIESSSVTIVFTSSSIAKGTGFSLTYFGQSRKFVGPGDGLIRVLSSSSIMLSLRSENQNYKIPNNSSMEWSFTPAINQTSVHTNNVTMYHHFLFIITIIVTIIILIITRYFFFLNFKNISCSSSNITLYNKYDNNKLTPIFSFCGNFSYKNFVKGGSYKWIETNTTKAVLKFYNNGTKLEDKNFELAYYSDGSNSHCGFTNNPAYLKAPSMIFTDGSSSFTNMYSNQNCDWHIAPPLAEGDRVLVIDFLEQDLIGASLIIYDNQIGGPVLWECNQCRVIPRPILSLSGSVYVSFTTSDSLSRSSLGKGFRAVYYTITSKAWIASLNNKVLELPPQKIMDMDLNNKTLVWKLEATSLESTLSYFPRVTTTIRTNDVDHIDGRPNKAFFIPPKTTGKICGFVSGNNLYSSYLNGNELNLLANQHADNYYRSDNKKTYTVKGSIDLASSNSAGGGQSFYFEPSTACKYEISSGSNKAIEIKIISSLKGKAVVKIYAGVYGNGNAGDGIATGNIGAIFDESQGYNVLPSSWIAPCGKTTIILDSNGTSTSSIDYGLEISYSLLPDDNGEACDAYKFSLLPVVIKEDPYLKYYIAFGSTLGGLVLLCCCFCCRFRLRLLAKRAFVYNRSIYYSIKKVTPNHPKYSPRMDAIRNRFLREGMCCICQDPKIKVLRLPCKHGLCIEDVKGYLESALGDISMFPLKCPMHYEGCKGSLGGHVAKRVLNEIQYEKFVEFSDRATYGEGMRCIFCGNYVNYPHNTRYSMVQCPYCIQNFCIRCKKPWHFQGKCPLDTTDESLDTWKNDSGAQKCPACSKLIEKSDVETCNHMVHKITDGIPCIRDRTDFCYLCGEEVTSDYPHEEVNNLGVNHFPDGVFQKCRFVINQEKADETERLRKLRRKKNVYTTIRATGAAVSPTDWDNDNDEWEDLESTLLMSSMTQENMLERLWVVNSDDQKSPNGSVSLAPSNGSPEQTRPSTGNSNVYARTPPGHPNPSRLNPLPPMAGRAVLGRGGRGGRAGRGR